MIEKRTFKHNFEKKPKMKKNADPKKNFTAMKITIFSSVLSRRPLPKGT